jgi:hypothetical protein
MQRNAAETLDKVIEHASADAEASPDETAQTDAI